MSPKATSETLAQSCSEPLSLPGQRQKLSALPIDGLHALACAQTGGKHLLPAGQCVSFLWPKELGHGEKLDFMQDWLAVVKKADLSAEKMKLSTFVA